MKNSPDPSVHRQREQQFIQHVQRLLNDERLRLDTTRGNRSVSALAPEVRRPDPGKQGADLRRQLMDLGLSDRELESRMPLGETLDVTLYQTSWWVLKQAVGRLRVVCLSPTKSLLRGESPEPMHTPDLQKVLASMPPAPPGGVPVTLVLLSTSGFTLEAREVADRRPERTVILVEPNDAGGWTAIGPPQTKAIVDLFDPEAEEQKRRRVREFLDANKVDLLTSGIAADRIAARTQLPPQFVEQELKAYARDNPGLTSKRLDGRVVLYREGASVTSAPGASGAASTASGGGSAMPLIDSLRALFGRKGENEKKIAFLAERRTALSQQRDRAYEDMGALEQQEAGLRQQFKDATGALSSARFLLTSVTSSRTRPLESSRPSAKLLRLARSRILSCAGNHCCMVAAAAVSFCLPSPLAIACSLSRRATSWPAPPGASPPAA